MAKAKELIRKTCHTKCYAFDTLWIPGDIYEGEEDPGKHFSDSGEVEIPPPPPNPGDDPRSNAQLKAALKAHPFNFTVPSSWPRKKIWQKLRDLENAYDRDESTNPNPEKVTSIPAAPKPPKPSRPAGGKFKAPCGYFSKSGGGLAAHIRKCGRCKAIAEKQSAEEGHNKSED
jgi:hypothetical protein